MIVVLEMFDEELLHTEVEAYALKNRRETR